MSVPGSKAAQELRRMSIHVDDLIQGDRFSILTEAVLSELDATLRERNERDIQIERLTITYSQHVDQLKAACASKDEALHLAWRDILEWTQLATNHRKFLGNDADHAPYCATRSGIEKSEAVQKTIGQALSSDCGKDYFPLAELGNNTPWQVTDVLRKLAEATDILLTHYGYDGQGHEEISGCRHRALEYAARLEALNPKGKA